MGGYNQVDLAVDEQGLWALWGFSSNSYKLKAQMIDIFYGTTLHSWNLNTGTTNFFFIMITELIELN